MSSHCTNLRITCRTGMAAGDRRARRGAVGFAAALPVVLTVAAAAAIQLHAGLQAALQFDRQAVAAGQFWRLLTCHLVHCGGSHLAADMVGFVTLWWLACRRPRPVSWMALAAAAVIGLALCFLAPHVATYRGMSGVNFALFGYLLVIRLGEPSRLLRAASWAFLATLVFEVIYEVTTGRSLTANSLPAGVTVVGVVHAAGLATGVLVAALCARRPADANARTSATHD